MPLYSVDLFCGAGGLSNGLESAGFTTAFALDADERACETFTHNLSCNAYNGYLEDFPCERILSCAGLSRGEVAVVCGGPPCQGFSVQRRGPQSDSRNNLVVSFVRTAVALDPVVVLMENVRTVLGARGERYLKDAVLLLEQSGYRPFTKVVNAADFGVPQLRRRAFLLGIKREVADCFKMPSPTHNPENWLTVKDAIGDMPEPPTNFSEHPEYPNHVRVKMSELNLRRLSFVPEGGGRLNIPLELRMPCHRNDNGHRHLDVFGRMRWNHPAPTITAMFDNFTRGRFAHPSSNRCITGREGARLQSFPDRFKFFGGKKDVARQIGNAVPPRLAFAIGRAVRSVL
jgi:DNA (cytosine-5)-methyltransferase 1